MAQNLTVRVSRLLLLLLSFVGLVFFAAGADMGFLGIVFDESFGADKPVFRWLFTLFCLGVGGLLCLTQAVLFLFPPVMMRATDDTISFGTGLLYRQLALPRRALQSVRPFTTLSDVEVMGQRNTVVGGVELLFKRDAGLPHQAVTSAGLSYSDYTLRLFKRYMNCSVEEVVEKLGRR